MVHQGTSQPITVYALLDTGCTTPLISNTFVDKWSIPCLPHKNAVAIRNFTGDIVNGAWERYTIPMLLQHQRHFTQEVFKAAHLEPGVDVFLPFWWIAKHAPQSAWDSDELCFSTPQCLKNCTRSAVTEFTLDLDESILLHSEARVIGYVSAVEMPANDPLVQVLVEFRQFLYIMGKDAADTLLEHRSYNHSIDLKPGENPPWGPIYPLSETELQALGEWLKEMQRTGKIRRSTSSTGSPILFIPKPSGHGLRLCVDYRGIS